ncbi:protein-tyrosine-phosphatase [Sphingomonas changnyeongensis]|uniref:Protein-tyrosine-phosphatase n=2 Tax=Sphingomonas changnyeongensis TaxID=2698679 RepID=A0A7Z2NZ05_9SPHN|nr:protein-tyrosine-phosphatase [Sphingomonas changnyeongensis]
MHKLLAGALLLAVAAPAQAIGDARVERIDAATVRLTWTDAAAVDIYVSPSPDATRRGSRPVIRDDRDGREDVAANASIRQYFLIRDRQTGEVRRVAERVLPLERGSNFRDLGGYPAAGGKRVKWGRIFRSGAMPLLSDGDYAHLKGLGLGAVIDLRSLEERAVAPTMLDDRTGALFIANDYSARAMFAALRPAPGGGVELPDNLYAGLGDLLEPQLRAVFDRLLAGQGNLVYHCSAGQDRTGITSALVLTLLGVPRDVILADYHLSTPTRRPEFEMPPIDPAAHPDNPIVQYYAAAAKRPGGVRAEPLYDRDGVSHLAKFLAGLEAKHGSVMAYLEKTFALTPDRVARLRAMYLE